jgi:hypothetical protein
MQKEKNLIFGMSLNYNLITKFISASRLQNYEIVCLGDNKKALKLYQTNLRLAQAFYPLLSLFEVILRNALNEELTVLFTDTEWLTNQQTGFMNHPSLTYRARTGAIKHNCFLKNSVAKSIADLGPTVTQGKIIADLTFGFWTALFDRTHYRILSGRPIQIFVNLPPGANRNMIHQKLERVRDFRNRVYHNEPVIFKKEASGTLIFSLAQAQQIYSDIREFFQWLNLDFDSWTKRINNINFEISRAEVMMKLYPSKKYFLKRLIIGFKHYHSKYL